MRPTPLAPLVCALWVLLAAAPSQAGPVTTTFGYLSTVSSTITGPLQLFAELNYDDAVTDAPIAVVMHGYSPSSGNFANVRPHAQRLRDAGFFAVSVAMRGRDGSAGSRDSGGLEIHDIWDAVESVKQEFAAHVDATNVHITGYSGGGGNAMSAVVRFPDYFRVASSFFGMSDYGFDPVNGWYNFGAGGRTSILDQDVGNPNLGDPVVIDRYHARASNLAAANSRYTEVHLFVNDDETICPLVNHQSFAAIGGSHVVLHVGDSSSPVYEDFNGNGSEDPGELQLWPHGFPTASQQAAGEQWYLDRLLAGAIPEPEVDPTDTLSVPGFLKTRSFEIWLGDGQEAAGIVTYALGAIDASFTTEIASADTSLPIDVVVHSGFMGDDGTIDAYLDGELVDSFPSGIRRVFFGLPSGGLLELEKQGPPSVWIAPPWALGLGALVMAVVGVRSAGRGTSA